MSDIYCAFLESIDFITGCSMYGKVFKSEDIIDELQGLTEQIVGQYIEEL